MPPEGTPVSTDHRDTVLEGPPRDRLDHPVPEIEHPAVVPRAPPPAAKDAQALRCSIRISRLPVRYGNPACDTT